MNSDLQLPSRSLLYNSSLQFLKMEQIIKRNVVQATKEKAYRLASSNHFRVSTVSRQAHRLAKEAFKNFESQLITLFNASPLTAHPFLKNRLLQFIETWRHFFYSTLYVELRGLMLIEANKKNIHVTLKA
ncbi:hypothetical protein [Parachlamydia sp. AcF125]|uniref:hypothetical protein n=1 Tax=Parachlamydia sp. AcF125 TaxID=2795736 RepID=UPI001BD7F9F3|nr:hypothetical protein [Parachlamydia sp. AcF125]MBS4169115.1 hypothetical protein [Parachlamydia sp. AcF125]